MINVGDKPTTVSAFLSYAERDLQRNKRHLTTADPPSGLGADERPLLSLYVMKSKVPERRYVGVLSPYVEEYVAHSVVTNAWCVSARWTLEPGDVYAVLAVMAEGTTHEVPLRLTLYTPPDDATQIMCKPLTPANEWHVTALHGHTDAQGLSQIELLPSAAEGTSSLVQAALVMETETPEAFCSIATELDRVPHKMLVKYQQQQAVLSVPFAAGSMYTMTTRCINQRQEPVRNTPLKLLLYSERPLQATPQPGAGLSLAPNKMLDTLVSKATADQIIYGDEGHPEDSKRQVTDAEKEKEEQNDPTVLHAVISELEEQRDLIAAFAKSELKGEPDPQMERLRAANNELREQAQNLNLELKRAKAIVARNEQASRATDKEDQGAGSGAESLATLKQQLAEAQRANATLQETVGKMSGGGDSAMQALNAQLIETQKELAQSKASVQRLETDLKAQRASGGSGGSGGGGNEEVAKLREQNRELKKKLDEAPKSAACVLL